MQISIKRAIIAAILVVSSGASAADKTVTLYNFDQIGLSGFGFDHEPEKGTGELRVNTKPANKLKGAASLEADLDLQAGGNAKVAKYYQSDDQSAFHTLVIHLKAEKPGLKAKFYAQSGPDWKWVELPSSELQAGKWTELKVAFKDLKDFDPAKFDDFGLVFEPVSGEYKGKVWLDEIQAIGSGVWGREKYRKERSPFAEVKSTVPVDVAVDGSVAYGTVKRGIISFNLGGVPTRNDPFVSKKLKEAGPGIMRMWSYFEFNPALTNPSEGIYHWERIDAETKHLLSLGWEPMFCLGQCQPWNQEPKRYVPADFNKWAAMAAEAVKHFNKDLNLHLQYWEIWNEHDIFFWGGTEEEYLKLLKTATEAMKKVDPTIHIFAGAWSNPGLVKQLGGKMLDTVPPQGRYDGISWHNYLSGSIIPEKDVMSLTPLLEAPAYRAWEHLAKRGLDRTMEVGMSEANICPSMLTDWRQEGMLSGVYWASCLTHFIQQNVSLSTLFVASGDEEYGVITDRAKPSYSAMQLFSRYAKVVGKQWLETSYKAEENPSLETLALASDREFSIVAVNKDLTGKAYQVTYQLKNLPPLSSVEAAGIDDGNREAGKSMRLPLKDNSFTVTLKPYSVTVFRGSFAKKRELAEIRKHEPTKAALGIPVLGQYSWNGAPAVISKVARAIVINGDTAEFGSLPAIDINPADPARVVQGKVKDQTELSAKVWLAYDDQYVYLGCNVKQGRKPLNNKDAGQLWNGDGLEFYLSSKTDLAYVSRLQKSDWDYQACMAPTSKSGEPVLTFFGRSTEGAVIKSKPTDDGYMITVKIPVKDLDDFNWASGKKVRFDVSVFKAGADGNRAQKMFWNAVTDAWDSPDGWGLAEIKGQ